MTPSCFRGAGRVPYPGRRGEQAVGERGSATLELVVWAPGLLLIVGLLLVAGRVSGANGAVEQAAVDAARTASLARSPAAALSLATATARQTLAAQGLVCTVMTVTVDTSGFSRPPGQPATVSATVTCPVRLSDLSLPGVPGTRIERHTSISALDTFRERS
jgi:Flp pilus assembly protein TadG